MATSSWTQEIDATSYQLQRYRDTYYNKLFDGLGFDYTTSYLVGDALSRAWLLGLWLQRLSHPSWGPIRPAWRDLFIILG